MKYVCPLMLIFMLCSACKMTEIADGTPDAFNDLGDSSPVETIENSEEVEEEISESSDEDSAPKSIRVSPSAFGFPKISFNTRFLEEGSVDLCLILISDQDDPLDTDPRDCYREDSGAILNREIASSEVTLKMSTDQLTSMNTNEETSLYVVFVIKSKEDPEDINVDDDVERSTVPAPEFFPKLSLDDPPVEEKPKGTPEPEQEEQEEIVEEKKEVPVEKPEPKVESEVEDQEVLSKKDLRKQRKAKRKEERRKKRLERREKKRQARLERRLKKRQERAERRLKKREERAERKRLKKLKREEKREKRKEKKLKRQELKKSKS